MSFLNRTKPQDYRGNQDNDKDQYIYGIFCVILLIGTLGVGYLFFMPHTNPFNPTLQTDGLYVQIYQEILLSGNTPSSASSPRSASQVEAIYSNSFDTTTGLSSTEHINIDTSKKMESSGCLLVNATQSRRFAQPVNTTIGAVIDYDETGELSFFYFIEMWKNYNGNSKPYLNIFVEVSNSTGEKVVLGFMVYGDNRLTNQGQFNGINFPIPDKWFDLRANTYIQIWSMFYLSDIRSYLNQIPQFQHNESSITIDSVKFFVGDDQAINKNEFYRFDYMRISTKPIYTSGGAWYDDSNHVVSSYQIITTYSIIALDVAFNISSTNVYSNIKLFIKDYMNIDRIIPTPAQTNIVQNLMSYMDLIDLTSETGLTISSITYNGNSAHQINGTKVSNFIPLRANVGLGKKLQYRPQANYTVIGEQFDGDWVEDSLTQLRDLSSFQITNNKSIWVS